MSAVYVLKRLLNITTHMLINTGDKLQNCEICGISFTLKCNLKTHMLIHTGDKPHNCATCG